MLFNDTVSHCGFLLVLVTSHTEQMARLAILWLMLPTELISTSVFSLLKFFFPLLFVTSAGSTELNEMKDKLCLVSGQLIITPDDSGLSDESKLHFDPLTKSAD